MYEALRAITTLIAPILAVTAEDIWAHMPKRAGDPDSVHLATFPAAAPVTEAAATAAHEHVKARPRPREVEDERSRAIGGVVIDDEHLQPGIDPEDTIDKLSDRPAFVVGRRDDEHAPWWPDRRGGQISPRLRWRVCPLDSSAPRAAHSADPPRRIRANRRR